MHTCACAHRHTLTNIMLKLKHSILANSLSSSLQPVCPVEVKRAINIRKSSSSGSLSMYPSTSSSSSCSSSNRLRLGALSKMLITMMMMMTMMMIIMMRRWMSNLTSRYLYGAYLNPLIAMRLLEIPTSQQRTKEWRSYSTHHDDVIFQWWWKEPLIFVRVAHLVAFPCILPPPPPPPPPPPLIACI